MLSLRSVTDKNRDPFTEDSIGSSLQRAPSLILFRLTLDAGIVKLIIDLDFSLCLACGGAAFRLEQAKEG